MFRLRLNDVYHRLLRISWARLIGLFALVYVGLICSFGLAYYALDAGLAGVQPHSLSEHIWFSAQTVSTVGYGQMYPETTGAHLLVAAEVFLGLTGFSLATGLFFSKFSRPTARVRFSEVMIQRDWNGVPTLQFRIANQRSTNVLEAKVAVYALRDETTTEGDHIRRFYPLELQRANTPVFGFSFTVIHQLDDTSPLTQNGHFDQQTPFAGVIVSFTGIDEAMARNVHARHAYQPDDIRFGHKFSDILQFDGLDEPVGLAIERIDQTESLGGPDDGAAEG